jgi:LmbE family N-acetylglucosaminyl deacetylase
MSDLSVLGLFAHPDDEQVMSGVFAQAASEGIRTGLVCATRGEAGQIHESVDATRETIGQVRESELRAAAVVCGIKDLWFLDYRDSGWIGTPDNQDPRSFNHADHDEALGKIVAIVRDFKPTIMVTFDPSGGYGHLDHLMIHKLATEAFSAAADPLMFPESKQPWQAARLYYSTFSRASMEKFRELMMRYDADSDFLKLDFSKFGTDDSQITNDIDVRSWMDVKQRSVSHHRTQTADVERWALLPPDLMEKMRGTEHYILASGVPLPGGPEARGDLFAGLR